MHTHMHTLHARMLTHTCNTYTHNTHIPYILHCIFHREPHIRATGQFEGDVQNKSLSIFTFTTIVLK